MINYVSMRFFVTCSSEAVWVLGLRLGNGRSVFVPALELKRHGERSTLIAESKAKCELILTAFNRKNAAKDGNIKQNHQKHD